MKDKDLIPEESEKPIIFKRLTEKDISELEYYKRKSKYYKNLYDAFKAYDTYCFEYRSNNNRSFEDAEKLEALYLESVYALYIVNQFEDITKELPYER